MNWQKEGLEEELLRLSKTSTLDQLAVRFNCTKNAISKKLRRLRKLNINVVMDKDMNSPQSTLTYEQFLGELSTRLIVEQYQPHRVKTKDSTRKHDSEAVIVRIGDVHVGKRVESSSLNDLNKYNLEIFQRRLDIYLNKIVSICGIHKTAYDFTELVIFFLGDIIDGETIYAGHQHYIEAPVIDQFLLAKNTFVDFILTLANTGMFPRIRICTVWGNHGRIGRKDESEEHSNFDYLFYRVLADTLDTVSKDAPCEIICEIGRSFWWRTTVEDHIFVLMHGDNIKQYQGVPYYGITKADNSYMRMLGKYDYLEIGHFHKVLHIPNNGTVCNVNGSFVGGDIFSAKTLQAMSKPCQVMTGCHHRHGITWRYDIDISED